MPETVRIRVEVRAVLEYDARLEDYDTTDPDEVVRIDRESAEEDIYLFLDTGDTEWTVEVSRV